MKRILILSPHTDDAELGCGGTIRKFIEAGKEVRILTFSCGTSNAKEFHASVDGLGSESKLWSFETRYFPRDRQEILQKMIDERKEFYPDTVFLPASDDVHQDHQVIYQEGVRAFKHVTVYAYELPWNSTHFRNQCYSGITPDHLQAKINALKHYESQSAREYMNEEFIRSLAVMRGVQAGVKLAECFEVVRQVI